MTNTTSHKPLTTTTWASIGGCINATPADGSKPLYWDAKSDLGHQLADMQPHLTREGVHRLVSAAGRNLPLRITWDRPFGPDRIERITRTLLVESLHVHPNATFIRVHYWGFNHNLYLSNIRAIAMPEDNTQFLSHAEAAQPLTQ